MDHDTSNNNSSGVRSTVRNGLIVLRRLVIFFGLIAFCGMLWLQSSDAQEITSDSLTTQEAPKIEIITRPKENVNLTEGVPTPVKLKLDNIPGAKSDLADGVIVNGYARYVTVDDEIIGQLMLTGLEKGDAQEPLNEENFTGQFAMKGTEFKTVETFTVDGDQQELVAALQALQAKALTVEPEPEEEKEIVDIEDDSPAKTGSETSGNDIAAGYSSPEAITPSAEIVTSVLTTQDGCSIRIDEAQGVAIVQSKVQTFEDGVMTSEGECSDELIRYPLEKSYSLCDDEVDLTAKTATAQYQTYFVDDSQTRTDVGTCTPDTETVFDIVESFDGCTISLNYIDMTANPQSSLVYSNSSNVEIEVRSCSNSETKTAVPLTQTTASCSVRHDFSANKSMSQSIWTYQQDGVNYQAGTCTDDGTEYSHTKAYKDDVGNYLCSSTVNFSTNQVTLQSRTYITVNGLKEFITECTPDTTSLGVQVTTQGCTNPDDWTHDITAEQSFGNERYYYVDNGETVYVTECQKSTTTYQHQVETSSWENHDDQRYAYQLSNIYIDAPTGKYYVATNTIIDGTVQMPYQLSSVSEIQNGTSEYTGCEAMRLTDKSNIWSRPDGSQYTQYISEGEPVGPQWACSGETKTWTRTRFSYNNFRSTSVWDNAPYRGVEYPDRTYGFCGATKMTYHSRGPAGHRSAQRPCFFYNQSRKQAVYNGIKTLNREDGEQITQNSSSSFTIICAVGFAENTTSAARSAVNGISSSYIDNVCPPTATNSMASNFNANEGW